MSYFLERFQPLILVAIILVSGGLMFYAAWQDSATFDESAHIPAGYSYVKYFDYRLNHEHPPLVKILSGIPLLFMDLKFPTDDSDWTTAVNGQFSLGGKFFYEYGNDADAIIFWARVGPVLLTLALIFLVYIFGREIVGPAWAFLPAFLIAFSPTILAHGHFVTTDIGAAFGTVLAFYFFFKFLYNPSGKYIFGAGAAFGVAQLLKFSNLLLGPIFIILAFIFWLAGSKNFFMIFSRLFLVFVVGLIAIYFVYAPLVVNYPAEKQVKDIETVIGDFKPKIIPDSIMSMARNPVLRPLSQYMFGAVSVWQRARGGNSAFFLGELSSKGWWYYFPTVYLLKEPIPVLLLVLLGFLLAVKRCFLNFGTVWKRFADYVRLNYIEFSLAFFAVFYWLNSIVSPLNIGVRHILPTLPFIYLLATVSLQKWAASGRLKYPLIFALLFWFAVETAFVSPHYTSYFNWLVGGTKNGYLYVTDSNYDWGQDLKRLKKFADDNKIQKIAVDYFGGGSPKYYLGEKEENWWSARGNPKSQGIEWLAVSVNTLQGAFARLTPGFERKPEDEYRWLKELRDPHKPDARAGYSIFIYKL